MPLFDARDLIAFPAGDNSSDTVIAGIHFNLTSLDRWNYTLYSNGTLSNGTKCFLTFAPYTPALVFPNGTLVNVTSCYSPVNPMGTRGAVGIGFAVAFGLALVLTLVSLAKHGKQYLPAERRFWPIGRRWQWYWAAVVCAAAAISLLTNIDVDRYYLPQIPIVLNAFFWFLMQEAAMALVWEAVRHWGSWMERQLVDPNPFALPQDDRRGQTEFWIPLIFYFWLWLNFFLIVPRSWTKIEHQRYPEQTAAVAAPAATDGRFKAAGFCLALCWLVTAFSLRHSIRHYLPRNRGLANRAAGLLRLAPPRFLLLLPLAACLVAYQLLVAFDFAYSPLRVHGTNLVAMYAGGYAPALLIVLVNAVWGLAAPNEDRELIRQRRERGAQTDRELGIVRKPAWWRRAAGHVSDPNEPVRDRIARHVRELGGGRATARHIDEALDARAREQDHQDDLEMTALRRDDASITTTASRRTAPPRYTGRSDARRQERTVQLAAGLLFPDADPDAAAAAAEARRAELMQEGPPPYSEATRPGGRQPSGAGRPSTVGRSNSTGTTNSISGPPQQIRSMLDV